MICHSCHVDFPDYRSLAIHISTSKKGHKKGKKWASKYLLINGLSAKNKYEHPERTPLTEEEKESKKNAKRELSGKTKYGQVFCPRCKQLYSRTVEVEYTDSPYALRKKGALVITCENCGGKT